MTASDINTRTDYCITRKRYDNYDDIVLYFGTVAPYHENNVLYHETMVRHHDITRTMHYIP